MPRGRRLDLRTPDRRRTGRIRQGTLRRHLDVSRSPTGSATSRCSTWPTSCRPPMRLASCRTVFDPVTSWPSSDVAPSACPRSSHRRSSHRQPWWPSTRWPAVGTWRSSSERDRAVAPEEAQTVGDPHRRAGGRRGDRGRGRARRPSSCAPSWCVPVGTWPMSGVHGKPATLHLESLWIKDVTITTGLVDTSSIPTLLRLIKRRANRPPSIHHPPLSVSTRPWRPMTPSRGLERQERSRC